MVESDDEPPILEMITTDIDAYEGDTVTIKVNFSDNNEVSSADLFYKREIDTNFSSKSILNKTADIQIPLGSGIDWEYYVVIDDPAGNGPVGMPSINGSITYKIQVLTKNDGNDTTDDNTTYQRYVFIEESTAESCTNCPEVAESLHELYESGKYNFHYVSLIAEDTEAKARLDEYNVEAYPVVFVDGGYNVILGKKSTATYENAIQSALERETPDIRINLTATFDKTDNETDITIKITNMESSEYKGKLKVYLAEIVSEHFQDSNAEQYRHAFLEFAINKDITISSNGEITETKTLNAETFDPENLLVYAVVFSNDKHEKYQNPDEETYPFNAYYVDACAGVQVVEGGNLPPSIGIHSPENGKIYFMGRKINLLNSLTLQQTLLIGRSTFNVSADDKDGIEKIELYIDDVLTQTFNSDTVEYIYKNSKIFDFKHTIKFTAYDTQGKSASASLDIQAFTSKASS